jgi:hypothetical protein
VWYTLRCYIGKGSLDTWEWVKNTVQGDQYINEQLICECEITPGLAHPETVYFGAQRYATGAGISQLKEFRAYMGGYPTDAPPVVFVADAGAGSKFTNLYPPGMSFPSGFVNSQAIIQWAFHDDSTFASRVMSDQMTLAAFNALPKQIGKHRFVEIHVLQASDGNTQSLATELNGDSATDEAGASGGGISKSRLIGGI